MGKRIFIVKYICYEEEYEKLKDYLMDNHIHISAELLSSSKLGSPKA